MESSSEFKMLSSCHVCEQDQFELYTLARSKANEALDELYDNVSSLRATKLVVKSRTLTSGHAAANFVYGEISFCDFSKILKRLLTKPGEKFIDCGCGAGVTIAAAALCYIAESSECLIKSPIFNSTTKNADTSSSSLSSPFPYFSQVCGVDLMRSKIEEGQFLLEQLNTLVPQLAITDRTECVEEDFLEKDWSDADIVYVCATCFTVELLSKLFEKLTALKIGARIILLDKELNVANDLLEPDVIYKLSKFHLQFIEQCKTTWGSGYAYVYQKMETVVVAANKV